MSIRISRAERKQSDEVASVFRSSRKHFLPYIKDLHTLNEDMCFFRNVVFNECVVWIAEDAGKIVGFCAFKKGWIDHLYLLPSHVGRSVGAHLLEKAQAAYPLLELWTFQQNTRAINFYQHHGFLKIMETDGSGCAEGLPDALFQWRKN